MIAVRQRFAYILKAIDVEHLRRHGSPSGTPGRPASEALAALDVEYQRRRAEIERLRDAVKHANEPTVTAKESASAFANLSPRRFTDNDEEERFPVEDWAAGPLPELRTRSRPSPSAKGSLTHGENGEDQRARPEDLRVPDEDPLDG